MSSFTPRRARRTLVIAAAVAAMASAAGVASAQYRIDNGQARDANNRIGSGGYNDRSGDTTNGGLNGNLIITGNVANGRSFRGALGYVDQNAFRGNVGSAAFDNFNRDSVGIGQVRNSSASVYANQSITTFRPYYGAGRTVTPPAGFARDAATGGYVIRPPRIVQANDARMDYGGASRAQVAYGSLVNQGILGGAGLAASGYGVLARRDALDKPYNSATSEYTTLARPAARIGLLEQSTGETGIIGNGFGDPRDIKNPNNQGPTQEGVQAGDAAAERAAGRGTPGDAGLTDPGGPPSNGVNLPGTVDGTPGGAPVGNGGAALGSGGTVGSSTGGAGGPQGQSLTSTGQSSRVVNTRENPINPQYAALRARLQQQGQSTAAIDAVERSNQRNRKVLAQQNQAEQGQAEGKNDTNKAATPEGGTPGMPKPDVNAPATPDDSGRTAPGDKNSGDKKKQQQDGPTRPMPLPQVAGPQQPVDIHSFTTDVRDPQLKDALGKAEGLMKAGKFTSAIEAFDRAQGIAKDDGLVFAGRGIAELGGGFYRNAEMNLRQAYQGDRSLAYARFDLNALLTPDRLNGILADLGKQANANPRDPGPMMLLAFVYYNANLPDRASRALDLAQERAGGKDAVVKLLKDNWALAAPAKPAAGEDMNK